MTPQAKGNFMPGAEPEQPSADRQADRDRGENETILTPSPASATSAFEAALEQYAATIERLRAESGAAMDPYSRGFVAGLRAAIKVVANAEKAKS
jgi:hypothetical protein